MNTAELPPHLSLLVERSVQEHLDGLQARATPNRIDGLACADVMVGVDVEVVAALREAAGPVSAQGGHVVSGPGVDRVCAERGSPDACQLEEPGADATVLVIRVHGDGVDSGKGTVNRQVQYPDDRARFYGNQLRSRGRGLLDGHDIVEVRSAQEGQDATAKPGLLIRWFIITDLYRHGLDLGARSTGQATTLLGKTAFDSQDRRAINVPLG
jgi:hypothetical protein